MICATPHNLIAGDRIFVNYKEGHYAIVTEVIDRCSYKAKRLWWKR